ncbi:hypothetical protein CN692_03960 [Bacillus sp. AFS002410]|uniref:DUF2500 domain-containing protein n=1 Tax=Bacillus sp. AFS002410 TaxID=2033481 RepID=UPI000BF16F35|nr:DUF2500 domain-containing protein [Bacillus sp. AFS002410]PEJ59944.1 hypothetical protein CN692_03960 [Bacillus sp. AFS002410]
MFEGGDFLFTFGPIFIGIMFVIVLSIIVFSIIKGISQWNKNNNSPKLYVKAKAIAKRTAVRGGGENRSYSSYFVTFEVESGDRIEFQVKDAEYGMIVEGDNGELAFQGSRFLGFSRIR